MSQKQLVVCADDYGQSPTISAAILELIAAGRLTAVSCMAESPTWPEAAAALLPYANRVDIGLHFNLTHPFSDRMIPLSSLMSGAWLRLVDQAWVRRMLHHQLGAYESAMGMAPVFVDGHQHVHVFPVIRKVLIEVLKDRYGEKLPYLRSVCQPWRNTDAKFKILVLRAMGLGFERKASKAGFRVSQGLLGAYSLAADADYPALMQRWLEQVESGMVLMCHPGHPSDDLSDPIRAARVQEWRYLQGPEFEASCQHAGVVISRF
ncbi:MAG: ChbG/HpnK family deacetylase [Gammaproteobacteria bacterium]|nr:ChbG/HpnK family deacetylase [Gammaproteobacteria bacterium]